MTHRAVAALQPEAQPYRVPDLRCPGLAARVATNGTVTWDAVFRISGAGKVRRVSLGRFPEVGLDAARDRMRALGKAAREGRDLLAEEKAAAAAMTHRLTVAALIEEYAKRRVRGRLRTAKEIESRLRRALESKLDMPADALRRREIRELLEAVNDAGLRREAEKRRQAIGAMFRWAVSQDLVEQDPTAGLTAFDPGTERDRTLSAEEVRRLWQWLEGTNAPEAHRDVLRLQLATGARCGEVAGMDASEIDWAAGVWVLPASRSKNGRSRVTPLVGIVRSILEARSERVKKGSLFPSETGRPLTSTHLGKVLSTWRERIGIPAFTTHDLRRTVATELANMGIPLEVIAAVIGHEPGSKHTRTLVKHYLKSDLIERKRIALEAWDRRLREIISGAPNETNVTALLRAVG